MPMDDLTVEAPRAGSDRGRPAALAKLYGPCRCATRPRETVPPCAGHAVDPGLFRRLVRAGLGA